MYSIDAVLSMNSGKLRTEMNNQLNLYRIIINKPGVSDELYLSKEKSSVQVCMPAGKASIYIVWPFQ